MDLKHLFFDFLINYDTLSFINKILIRFSINQKIKYTIFPITSQHIDNFSQTLEYSFIWFQIYEIHKNNLG